ncbi:MAG: hypothetical protein KAS32_31140 [Candidatus Peribacteraceae bacterium]|nr:hypothetical protein [Candidatus Peribacteraceae bacterium]
MYISKQYIEESSKIDKAKKKTQKYFKSLANRGVAKALSKISKKLSMTYKITRLI